MYAIFFTFLLFFLLLFVMNDTDDRERVIEAIGSEGNSYKPYSNNNPAILAQTNAANIKYLKERLEKLDKIDTNFTHLQTEVTKNKNAITNMSKIALGHIASKTGTKQQKTVVNSKLAKMDTR
jgi:hypothetical protein